MNQQVPITDVMAVLIGCNKSVCQSRLVSGAS